MSKLFTEAGIVVMIVAVATVVSVTTVPMLRWLLQRSVRQAMTGRPPSFWNPRIDRRPLEPAEIGQERRLKRADALAELSGRIITALLWFVALLLVLNVLEVDVLLVVSSAGFVGAGLAFGGQHSVAAFFAGLHILWEDRFGVGDTLELEVRGEALDVTVERLGAFTTMLRSADAAFHVSNSEFSVVTNRSQGAGVETVTA